MREKTPLLLAVAVLLSLPRAASGVSQRHPAPLSGPPITLGNSAVPLTGPWRFSPGDSPWINGAFLWVQPDFDDSDWSALDLTPPSDPFDLQMSRQSQLPGWTAKGFPNLTGYAWYRLTLRVADPAQPLALKMPADFGNAYQLYANGQFVGQFGSFNSSQPTLYSSRPLTFALPPAPGGQINLAVRFYLAPLSIAGSSSAGGMHEPPVLGLPLAVQLIQSSQNKTIAFTFFGRLLSLLLFLLMAPAALWAWFSNRRERTFLWLFIALSKTVLFQIIDSLARTTFLVSRGADDFWLFVVLNSFWLPAWIMVFWYWFDLRNRRWIPILAWLTVPLNIFVEYYALSATNLPAWLPTMTRQRFESASLGLVIFTCLLLLVVLILGFFRDNAEALLAAVPILLLEFSVLCNYSALSFGAYPALHIFGLAIDFASLATNLLALVVGALFVRRLVQDRVRQELAHQTLQTDLEQARELQQRVLVPEELHCNCFAVETEYHASQTVGGDFFQTLSGLDGSLLIVIGDVSGKGISAAMLVAVLIGAARTRASETFDPAAILKTLNDRLIGRSSGHFATCLVVEIRPDGQMRMANAGHLPPYLNGAEIGLEGSLPLGSAVKYEPATRSIHLRSGDQLTFVTDGVVEARNADGELFGFDRTSSLALQSAANIALAAQEFGQNDDITVLRIHYIGPPIETFSIPMPTLSDSLP
jgi:serine/threonine protein phosphatase PrpC